MYRNVNNKKSKKHAFYIFVNLTFSKKHAEILCALFMCLYKLWQIMFGELKSRIRKFELERNLRLPLWELYAIFFWFLPKTDKSTLFYVFCLVRNHKISLLNFFQKITKMLQKQQFDIIIRCLKLGSKRANFSLITNNFLIFIYNKKLF